MAIDYRKQRYRFDAVVSIRSSMPPERRQGLRHKIRPTSGLRLVPQSGPLYGRVVVAQLVDASEGGLGVETLVELDPGLDLEVSADMVSSDLALQIAGLTRVAYCRETESGRYRIGLELIDISLGRPARQRDGASEHALIKSVLQ
jgi:hypothetical protein